ncbi:MAG TPA: PQQ-dependent sugar dehydrogenase [Rhizomicrobium sp.]|nr:PQQ-dependent sugar dehydrogenase [Rhizomicrobium sp.]
MKRIWLAALAIGAALSSDVLAQPGVQQDARPAGPAELRIPARKQQAPVPALLQSRANEIFNTTCAACHGATIQPGPQAHSVFTLDFLNSHSDAQIVQALTDGLPATPNHSFKTLFFSDEIAQMPAFLRIRGGILNRRVGAVPDIGGKVFNSQKANFKAETLVTGLDQPWGMAFLPDGRLIFTERAGRLRFMDKNGKISEPVKGTPSVFVRQDGGLLDVALHPDYAKNGWIYLSYSTVPPGYQVQPGDDAAPNMAPPTMTTIVRGKVNANNEWVDQQVLFNPPADSYRVSADHYGSRFLFDRKGHFYWSMGERHDMQMSQNLASPLGKIHRLNDDGSIPKDNPFVHTPGALPSIWTYGHRNPEGLTFDPATGIFWETEHGPVGGDEVNIIEPGKNYGWGMATMGIEPGIGRLHATGVTDPITFYNPSIGPSGIAFYTGDKFPAWKGNLFITGMVGEKLIRMEIKDRQIVSQEAVIQNYGRVRDVKTGPDGFIYVLLQNMNGDPKGGSIVRLVPAN